MNLMMVGAGSVGGFYGARLVKAGLACSFLLRPRTLDAVQRKGLTIHSVDESFTVHPRVSDNPRDLPHPDLIILSVKRYDLDSVIAQLQPILTPQTAILTLQNGVDTEVRIRELAPGIPVIGGVAYVYARIAEPGVINHYTKGNVVMGSVFPLAPGQPMSSLALPEIKALFEGAGIPCRLSTDIMQTKWEKLCWNVVFNPLTVVLNDCVAKALSHPEMLRIIRLIVDEAVAVARADGVSLAPDSADQVIQQSQAIREIHTSMYDDWKAGRRTEIDSLNGYLARRGRERGIPTPVNDALCALIKTLTEPPIYEAGDMKGCWLTR